MTNNDYKLKSIEVSLDQLFYIVNFIWSILTTFQLKSTCIYLNCVVIYKKHYHYLHRAKWRIQDFPEVGSPTYYFANILMKAAWKWNNVVNLNWGSSPRLRHGAFLARNWRTADRFGRKALRRKTQLKLACCQCTPDYYRQGNLLLKAVIPVRQSIELRESLFNLTCERKSLSKLELLIKREHA